MYMYLEYALQQKFINYLVTGLWKPSLILSRAVGHNYKDSSSINSETMQAFEVRGGFKTGGDGN